MLITLSTTSSICFGTKKFASWLFVMMHNLLYLSNLIGETTCRYARIIVNVSRPYFRQDRRPPTKNLVSGDETYCIASSIYDTSSHNYCTYRSVQQIHPPLCNLSLSTKCKGGGGLYTGCDNFSCNYASLLVKHHLIVCWGWGPRARPRH